MPPGESARLKAAELRIEADHYERGAIGEERVGAVLDGADREAFRVLHDRLVSPGKSQANLDHIVVAHSGIYLIDAKNWTGNITIYKQSLWQHRTSSSGRQSISKTQQVKQVAGMAAQMQRGLGQRVTPVLCLAGENAERFGPPAEIDGVHIVAVTGLLEWLQAQPPQQRPVDLTSLAVQVSCQFPPATGGALTLAENDRPVTSHRPASPHRRETRSSGVKRVLPAVVVLLAIVAVGPTLIKLAADRATHALAAAAAPTSTAPAMSPARAQTLDDWRIRAGLYAANAKPASLPYVADAQLANESSACRIQRVKLESFRPGLLKAPDHELAADAKRYDTAVHQLLRACATNNAVSLHHADGAMTVAATQINTRYARLLGEDPSSVYTKHVL